MTASTQRFIRMSGLATIPASGNKPGRQGRYPVAAGTIWRWVKLGKFPAPVQLGPQTTAWKVEDLEAWDANKRT